MIFNLHNLHLTTYILYFMDIQCEAQSTCSCPDCQANFVLTSTYLD